ncbi:hypothetical protein GOA93_30725, partial [Sinorhizobium meliloti]|nr:hypothetical protein [Sinorhizobium meliloti]
MPHFPRGPRQVHRRFRGRSCPSLISSVAVNPDALCRSENWTKRAKVRRLADSDEAAPLFRDDCAPGFRDDLAPC